VALAFQRIPSCRPGHFDHRDIAEEKVTQIFNSDRSDRM
jgi:hypothetical protein